MLKNYLSILIRGLRRSPVYSSLNIVGLAMGIAGATFILLWIEDEFSFDRGLAKRDHLYSVRMNLDYTGSIESSFVVPWRMAGAIHTGIPEVLNITRLWWGHDLFALTENVKTQSHPVVKTTYEDGLYADSSYFSMLQPEFVKGNAANFINQNTLVITKEWQKNSLAHKTPWASRSASATHRTI